jgi:predicted enzyme related to lactoylglutathione lyase
MSASTILYVIDLPKMATFYERGLGLITVERGDTHRVLESEAWELVLVETPKRIADTITITDPPLRRVDSPVKLVFAVLNLAETRTRVAEYGGAVDPAENQRSFRNTLRADGVDPEGNVFQLRQLGVLSN